MTDGRLESICNIITYKNHEWKLKLMFDSVCPENRTWEILGDRKKAANFFLHTFFFTSINLLISKLSLDKKVWDFFFHFLII